MTTVHVFDIVVWSVKDVVANTGSCVINGLLNVSFMITSLIIILANDWSPPKLTRNYGKYYAEVVRHN